MTKYIIATVLFLSTTATALGIGGTVMKVDDNLVVKVGYGSENQMVAADFDGGRERLPAAIPVKNDTLQTSQGD